MNLKSFTQTILAASVLSASVSVLAANDALCPSADVVRQSSQLLNTVSVMSADKFTVWSLDALKVGDYNWHITTYATANDLNTALVVGQKNVQTITAQKNKVAMNLDNIYLCSYSSATADETGVTAISFKNENASFKFASFNVKALNLGSH